MTLSLICYPKILTRLWFMGFYSVWEMILKDFSLICRFPFVAIYFNLRKWGLVIPERLRCIIFSADYANISKHYDYPWSKYCLKSLSYFFINESSYRFEESAALSNDKQFRYSSIRFNYSLRRFGSEFFTSIVSMKVANIF
jgi:hypothetical protein